MSSSRREAAPRQVPPPPNSRAGAGYTRFIPREELQGFSAWTPDAFAQSARAGEGVAPSAAKAFTPGNALHGSNSLNGARPGNGITPPAAVPVEPEVLPDATPTLEELHAEMQAEMQQQVAAARQQGYQDGYRDGLVALDSFKQSFASQVSAQMALVLQSLDSELGQLEQQMAASVARVASELARQVVRSELSVRPALVVQVAQEAVDAVLLSARHITVQVHPDDHALVAQGCEEVLAARGARLLSQPALPRGGCRVESDAGVIDARVATRWAQATQALGTAVAWDDDEAATVPAGGMHES